jgi:hypothetical protein
MTGGSRSDADFGSGSGETSRDCAIIESTVVNSPQATVVAQVKVGMRLSVTTQQQGGRTLLIAVTSTGAVVGSLTPRRLSDLLACIEQGNTYVAAVTSRNGGEVGVEIRPGTL